MYYTRALYNIGTHACYNDAVVVTSVVENNPVSKNSYCIDARISLDLHLLDILYTYAQYSNLTYDLLHICF